MNIFQMLFLSVDFPRQETSSSVNLDEVELCLRDVDIAGSLEKHCQSDSRAMTLPEKIPNDSPSILEVKNVSPIKFEPIMRKHPTTGSNPLKDMADVKTPFRIKFKQGSLQLIPSTFQE